MRYQFLRFPDGKAKAVTLSYDDGCKEDVRFSDIITEYGMKCTFNLNSESMRQFRFTKEDLENYYLKRGHEIAVHGANHRAEGVVRPIEGIRDVLECRMELENKLGIIIRGMAYPDTGISRVNHETSYDTIRRYLMDLDIAYSRTLGGDNDSFLMPNDWYAWMPTAHHKNPHIMEYINKFLNLNVSEISHGARLEPRLFYLWGHSYEFRMDNNWNLLEDICKKLSGHDDIWYATNIEIYNYVKAYESLEYSADRTIIYNPTLYDIWFDIDRTAYKISCGETLHLK